MSLEEEAARVCEETALFVTGKRGALRMPINSDDPEFSDDASNTFITTSAASPKAFRAGSVPLARITQELVWTTAATMLRGGFKSGQKVIAHKVGGVAS